MKQVTDHCIFFKKKNSFKKKKDHYILTKIQEKLVHILCWKI